MIDFSAPADVVAPQLLGCVLRYGPVAVRLTEVEAYLGATDAAAHTYRGMTPRNATMFGPPGRLYVYISYGIHRAANLVCAPEGEGQGCLLRAGEVVAGEDAVRTRRGDVPCNRLASGPGNLGKAFGFDLPDNGLAVGKHLLLTPPPAPVDYVRGPRIGISKNADAPLRFWLPGHPTVTTPRSAPQ
ncbi:DNA-3-methyladenine glycosylase [Corynebacterium incognita]|uniref:Putative 3-methyladenine DNA glycosylase n=1 Tax=Corynebacterium incognita TaxID=2754725 RepID=A0A7G7CM57_9CORY|nr:DNA-3-methyladenine glycosylase [Corynebacterium incognita]QNE88673.1 DNA-3-methyladenine glycosylase [Corynebacterium incognita]